MKPGAILKIFKKGAKAAPSGKGGGGAFEWPSGLRLGVFGHANSGKTVSFTVLNEECKVSKDLQVSVTDTATAGEFLTNYRALWGVGTSTDVGTMVDLREERKFPSPTSTDKVLQFNAIVDRKQKLSVVSYDYPGKAVSIQEPHDLSEKVLDFMTGCDGILFYFDPKVLGAELECQAHVASFVNMLERLAPLGKRLPIPVALVVTKADVLPGFSDDKAVLVGSDNEHLLADDYEVFLENVLTSNKVSSDSAWAGSLRDILVKLKEFLKIVIGRTLDFQIFFTSNTGESPEKIGTEVGRSVYAPPAKMSPIGIRQPFYWLLSSIGRNRRVSFVRKLAKYAAVLCLVWIALFSIPYLYHFSFLLHRTTNVEDNILEQYNGNAFNVTAREAKNIQQAYDRYRNSKMTKWVFEKFIVPAGRIAEYYRDFDVGAGRQELDASIATFANIVGTQGLWPVVDPVKDSCTLQDHHVRLQADLERFHQGDDSTSELFTRSDRVLSLWSLFQQTLVGQVKDPAVWDVMLQKIEHDQSLYAAELSGAEKDLMTALQDAASAREQKEERQHDVQRAGGEFDDLVDKINNSGPEYRLDQGVTKLKELRAKLKGDPSRQEDVDRIDRYLRDVAYFDESRRYEFTLDNCPDDHHVHIMVKKRGKSGTWPTKMLLKGRPGNITWRSGDHIVVALDAKHVSPSDETWGENPKAKKTLKSKAAIFGMEEITFSTGDAISISFKENLREKLPEL